MSGYWREFNGIVTLVVKVNGVITGVYDCDRLYTAQVKARELTGIDLADWVIETPNRLIASIGDTRLLIEVLA